MDDQKAVEKKIKVKRTRMERYRKFPWRASFDAAKNRCSPHAVYGKRGIKFLMKEEDFKFLWFRDKAYEMKQPSIDRILTVGNYVLENCRYIEL